ncbi:hypothetical protein TCAL_05369, partial [Tigriopus californicus]
RAHFQEHHERRLIDDLLPGGSDVSIARKYTIEERPVVNELDVLELKFGLELQQIIDINEKDQVISTNMWLNLKWQDYSLMWSPTEYGNISDIRLPPHKIWTPDILLTNSASQVFNPTHPTNIVVYNNGDCVFIPPGLFQSTCKINILWFPFDDQECVFKFISWTYDASKLNISLDGTSADLSGYVENGEWKLLGFPGYRHLSSFDGSNYTEAIFKLNLRRRTMYYFSTLILPCVLIASMSIFGFYLPPESGEKITLQITVLMALTFYMNMVTELTPQSSETPLLGIYFSCIMVMVAASVVDAILVLNFHRQFGTENTMPYIIKFVFLQWLPWILFMKRPGQKITRSSMISHHEMQKLELHGNSTSSCSLLNNVLNVDDHLLRKCSTGVHEYQGFKIHACPCGRSGNIVEKELKLILTELQVITNKIHEKDRSAQFENDWKYAAMVLDRLSLVVFTFLTLLLSGACLVSAPQILVY